MNKVKHIETLSILMVFALIFSASTANAEDIKDMLKKLKSSDKVEMRIPSSVAAARGIQIREDLRNEAATEAARESVRESIQSMAAEEVKTAEFECGKVLKDINGNWVRLEEYVVIGPKDVNGIAQDNQFKLMILNERTIDGAERLDYFKNLSTFNNALPTDPELFASLAGTIWESDTSPSTYLTKIENLAANDSGDKIEWTYNNGAPVNDLVTNKYVPIFKNYEYKINGTPKFSYAGAGATTDGSDRTWTVGDPLTSPNTGLTNAALLNKIDYQSNKTVDGGEIFTSTIDGKTATETYYFIDDNGKVTDPATNDSWNEELVFGATEFGGKTIDLVIAPDVFKQSGIGYMK